MMGAMWCGYPKSSTHPVSTTPDPSLSSDSSLSWWSSMMLSRSTFTWTMQIPCLPLLSKAYYLVAWHARSVWCFNQVFVGQLEIVFSGSNISSIWAWTCLSISILQCLRLHNVRNHEDHVSCKCLFIWRPDVCSAVASNLVEFSRIHSLVQLLQLRILDDMFEVLQRSSVVSEEIWRNENESKWQCNVDMNSWWPVVKLIDHSVYSWFCQASEMPDSNLVRRTKILVPAHMQFEQPLRHAEGGLITPTGYACRS